VHRSLFFFFILAWLLAGSSLVAQPTLQFAGPTVAFEGATPSGQVAFFSVARIPLGYSQRLEVRRELGLADASGRAEWVVEREPWLGSVWAAVDLASGEFALAAPPGGTLRQRPLDIDAFEQGAGGEFSSLRYSGHVVLEALVVRTAKSQQDEGVWGLRASDGGEADGDGEHNDEISLQPSRLEAISEGAPALSAFAAGDVVILIDSDRLEVSALRLKEATDGQGGER